MIKFIIFLILLIIIVNNLSYAYAINDVDCNDLRIKLYYSNGMFSSDDDTYITSKELQRYLNSHNHQSLEKLDLDKPPTVLYNTNEKLLLQLTQVLSQKNTELAKSFWKFLSNIDTAPEEFKIIVKNAVRLIQLSEYLTDSDLTKHVGMLLNEINFKNQVLIISHSQGNFYSNAAFEYIEKSEPINDKIKIVAVATPSNHVAGKGLYFTLFSDGIITAIPFSLPPNIKNINSGLFDHELINHYLKGNPSGEKIFEGITITANKFPKAENLSKWQEPPNLQEPNYVHRSLNPFRKWLLTYVSGKTHKLSIPECFAISSFLQVYAWFGEPCSKRSLNGIYNWIERCEKIWFNSKWERFDACYIYDLQSMVDVYEPSIITNALINNPECRIRRPKDLREKITPEVIKEAKKLLSNPF